MHLNDETVAQEIADMIRDERAIAPADVDPDGTDGEQVLMLLADRLDVMERVEEILGQ